MKYGKFISLGCMFVFAVLAFGSEQEPVKGREWKSPSLGMEFVWIDALDMWVGRFEVTNEEYRKKEPRHDSKSFKYKSSPDYTLNGERQPVVYINFDDAKAYAEWLTAQDKAHLDGLRYRLPSEDEWMIFAQCGDGREFPWGSEWPPSSGQSGNYYGQETKRFMGRGALEGYDDGYVVTAPVDELWMNPWGLHGVGGNVWEACASDSGAESFGAWRGASWQEGYTQEILKCSFRSAISGSSRLGICGFRLVLAPR